jgi:hypothetical protein
MAEVEDGTIAGPGILFRAEEELGGLGTGLQSGGHDTRFKAAKTTKCIQGHRVEK